MEGMNWIYVLLIALLVAAVVFAVLNRTPTQARNRAATPPPGPAPNAAEPAHDTVAHRQSELERLRMRGLITDDEYETRQRELNA